MPKTFMEKVWQEHVIAELGDNVALLQIDRVFLHEMSAFRVLEQLRDSGREPAAPRQVFTIVDHAVSTAPGRGRSDSPARGGGEMIESLRREAPRYGFTHFDTTDPQQGIVHVVAPERGIALPGLTFVCGDSHTCTIGGIGALAWGIGSTEGEHVLATQTLAQVKPKTMRVTFDGELAEGVTAKDLALALIGAIGAQGGIGHAVEFAGSAIRSMPIEGRLTLCNLSIEFSARFGFVPPDDITFDYLRGRDYAPKGSDWEEAVTHWRSLRTDEGAKFDREVRIDAGRVGPQVTWGTSPQHVVAVDGRVPDPACEADPGSRQLAERALSYMQLKPNTPLDSIPINAAYIGSCTNARLSDLRSAAAILKGNRVRAGVTAICVPGSTEVRRAAEAEGLDKVFHEAGFEWHESGCGFCGHIGDDRFANLRVISTTNRNFEGRQGPHTRTHLASPATVAASAIEGRIADVRRHSKRAEPGARAD